MNNFDTKSDRKLVGIDINNKSRNKQEGVPLVVLVPFFFFYIIGHRTDIVELVLFSYYTSKFLRGIISPQKYS